MEPMTLRKKLFLRLALLLARLMIPLLRSVKCVKWKPHYVLFLLDVPRRNLSKQDKNWLLYKQRPEEETFCQEVKSQVGLQCILYLDTVIAFITYMFLYPGV